MSAEVGPWRLLVEADCIPIINTSVAVQNCVGENILISTQDKALAGRMARRRADGEILSEPWIAAVREGKRLCLKAS